MHPWCIHIHPQCIHSASILIYCASAVHLHFIHVHPWCTHTNPSSIQGVSICPHAASQHQQPSYHAGTSHAATSQPAPPHPPELCETLHASKLGLNQIIPNNNDINYAFNTFYCFSPFPSRHICVNNIPKIYGFLP